MGCSAGFLLLQEPLTLGTERTVFLAQVVLGQGVEGEILKNYFKDKHLVAALMQDSDHFYN